MGDGLAEHMGTLASGVSTQVIIHPAARSTLTLVFDNPARGTRTIQEFDGTRLADGSVTQVVAVIQSDGKAVISERARKK